MGISNIDRYNWLVEKYRELEDEYIRMAEAEFSYSPKKLMFYVCDLEMDDEETINETKKILDENEILKKTITKLEEKITDLKENIDILNQLISDII